MAEGMEAGTAVTAAVDIPAVDTSAEGMEHMLVTAEAMSEALTWEERATAAVMLELFTEASVTELWAIRAPVML